MPKLTLREWVDLTLHAIAFGACLVFTLFLVSLLVAVLGVSVYAAVRLLI